MNKNIQDIYPLSPMQQGMLFHSLYAPETEVYSEQLSCMLHGKLNKQAFNKAWQSVTARHETLRSAFVWEDLEEPLQVVYLKADIPFEMLDWRSRSEERQNTDFEEILKAERKRGLELTEAPLMRILLIQLSDDTFRLIWNHHHLLLDGWGLPVILKEVMLHYEAFDKNKEFRLPQPRPYRDYIAWLQRQDMEKARIFWTERLKGFSAPTPLTVNLKDGKEDTGYGKERLIFSQKLSDALNALAKENQLTLNTLVQGAWALLLSRYSGEDDIVFGATVSGRPPELPGVETMLGLFINTLPVRIQINDQSTLLTWLKELQINQVETRQYEYSPLVKIQGWSDVPNNLPLFKSILVFENYPVGESLAQQESSLSLTDVRSFERTNYPITLVAAPAKQLALDIAYETKHFDKAIIKRILKHLETILQAVVTDPNQKLGQISIITEQEKQQSVYDWNRTEKPYPDQTTLHGWFEKQAEKTPDAVAVVFEDQKLTYKELNQRANQLARYLNKKGIGAEVIAGISLERSLEIIISILGVLKAGGAYLPIDPEYPADRINYMIEDSGLSLLITQNSLLDKFSEHDDALKVSLDDSRSEIAKEADSNHRNNILPHNLAYVIYTSGSTGKPKGVLLQHQGTCNFIHNMNKYFEINQESRLLEFASFSFDASVADTFLCLLNGAALHIANRETQLVTDKLIDLLNSDKISTVILPPSLLSILPEDKITETKVIASAGESCSWDLANRWKKDHTFVNGYGPTEGSVGCSFFRVEGQTNESVTVPIGKPLKNVTLYILDQNLNPAPVGVPGEIHIGGVGLARGYLNRPELSAEKFIPDPFSRQAGARLYKTGDLGRFLPDGHIEFVGRVDFQVKLRGFRIELGEIEAALKEKPGIKDAVVLAREDTPGDKRLAAYLIAEEENEIVIQDLRDSLKEQLPEYMIPAAFVIMESFPLTPNGKINRKALPPPEQADMAVEDYTAPRSPEEELLAGIWADILNLEKVGVNSSFFDLGGHSLMATQVISRIRDAFEVDIPLRSLFETSTIAELAQQIDKIRKGEAGIAAPPLEKISRDEAPPLSFAQQRLWFLDQLEPGSASYNIPSAIRLSGKLNTAALEKSINEIIKRHESLRTTFASEDGKPVQVISDPTEFKIQIIDLSALPETERDHETMGLLEEEAHSPFNLAEGPLFRAGLLKIADEEHIIVFNMHHIISDGWSVGVLVNEVAALYVAFSKDLPSPLPDLPIQYADFAHWQRKWLDGEVLEKQINYWKKQLAGSPPLLELPTDRQRPAVQTFNGSKETIRLSKELSGALLELSRKEGVTPFMTLLAAFQTLLHRYSGQDEILVGSPIANRTHSKMENLIGFFVNTLVMKADFIDNPNFSDLLRQVRETALGAYAHQDLPFEKLVEEIQPQRDLSHSPLFQVAFALQNAPAQEVMELPDLTLSAVSSESGVAKFDLTLTMIETGEDIVGSLEYNTDLFEKAAILRMINHFTALLEGIAAEPETEIADLPMLSEDERQKLLIDWNQYEAEFPDDKCVHQWFESYVEKQPQAPALAYKADSLAEAIEISYQEMNKRANQLARRLKKCGVAPEKIVGVCIERSIEMAVGMLAILKAGGAYVPIDPAYPKDRIEYMIEDSGLSVILTGEAIKNQLPQNQAQIICLDSEWESISDESGDNLTLDTHPDNLAYLIYTSGSTGKPKGTMLRHRGACNLAAAQIKAFNVKQGSRIMQFASLSFDAATWEFVMAMLSGAALILTNRETIAAGQELVKVMGDQKVTTITLPPSVLAVLPQETLPELQTIITAGEAVSGDLVDKWGNKRQFFNAYGPTETTVCASMHLCEGSYPQGPPIGNPISNFKLYILDKNLRPVPVGVPGELCIDGVGLARGYLNRPALTADKFIPNPFSGQPGARLYRSGDLARYLPDGNVEFLGRIDFQVKVRGFRIELGEIESLLDQHDQIKDLVVLAREDTPGSQRLVAYLVAQDEVELDVSEIKKYLRERLPDYMVPSAFVILDKLPLTPNGKIDRKALPAPEITREDLSAEYAPPTNEAEEKLVKIVGELLNIKKVGINDNFFELGGHSLLATQFMSRLRTAFGVELPLKTLFEKPTSAQIAEEIEKAKAQGQTAQAAPTIKRVSRTARKIKRSDLD